MLSSVAWLPNSSAVLIMDGAGNAAVLDMAGTPHSWNIAATAAVKGGCDHQQVLPYRLWGLKSAKQKNR